MHESRPLLSQLAEVHDLSVRDFASIFGISKSFAEEILNHKKMPSLELAIRISRYYEVDVEQLFGWRVEDDGSRRPLVVKLPGSEEYITLNASNRAHDSMRLLAVVAERIRILLGGRKKREAEGEKSGEIAEGGQSGVRDVPSVETTDS